MSQAGRWLVAVLLLLLPFPGDLRAVRAEEPAVSFAKEDGRVHIRIGGTDVATYVFHDEQVPRPYFAPVRTRSGIQVTRRHPPVPDQDATDHTGLHTGIWLSFGDLSGCDYWRLKARTEHVRFLEEPAGHDSRKGFTILNRYLTVDGRSVVAEETCRYAVHLVDRGWLLEMTSEFRPGDRELVFGDQEEMGLGIRVATPLAVDRKQGGRILDSAGRRNGAEVWGKTAEWCDYSGPLNGRWTGLTVLSDPANFRLSWNHARDYGFLAVNPFGRRAFTKQEASRVTVPSGQSLRLRFGVVIHESAAETEYSPAAAYRAFLTAK